MELIAAEIAALRKFPDIINVEITEKDILCSYETKRSSSSRIDSRSWSRLAEKSRGKETCLTHLKTQIYFHHNRDKYLKLCTQKENIIVKI